MPSVDSSRSSSYEMTSLVNYAGYNPPSGVSCLEERISANVSPEEFFTLYVKPRKPAIIGHLLDDDKWKGHLWTNKYLGHCAGDVSVLVEDRGQSNEYLFGLTARKVDMKYHEFLQQISEGNERFYLTTQDLERFESDLDEFDMPQSVLAEPLKSLERDFPVRPKIFGNLIPYQLSLWQGVSTDGTTSGLHHDFHDNLYILIRGKKRFRLFPPSSAPHMQTVGTLAKVYPNGLIVYQNSTNSKIVSVREDGVPLAFIARRKREDAEQDLADAEEELYSLENSGRVIDEKKRSDIERLRRVITECEDRIDEAIKDILKYEDTLDHDVISIHGDDSEPETDSDYKPKCKDDVQDDSEEPVEKRQKLENGIENPSCNKQTDVTSQLPNHFCKITLPTDGTDKLLKVYEDFPELKNVSCLTVDLRPGEMLYLPASWFHEVTSFSDDSNEVDIEVASRDRGHLALNYWMFPPDNDRFDRPYKDNFWQNRWEEIQDIAEIILEENSRMRDKSESNNIISLDSDDSKDRFDGNPESLISLADDSNLEASNTDVDEEEIDSDYSDESDNCIVLGDESFQDNSICEISTLSSLDCNERKKTDSKDDKVANIICDNVEDLSNTAVLDNNSNTGSHEKGPLSQLSLTQLEDVNPN